MTNDKRTEAVKLAMEQIEKQFGKGMIMRLGDESKKEGIEVISTGSIALDLALGIGGVPKGRVVEIYGPESSGKCVTGPSMVFSEEGMLPIASFGNPKIPEFQDKYTRLYSQNSTATATHFYNGGLKPTIRIKTRFGYQVEGTPNHRIRVINEQGDFVWRRLDKIGSGDHVAIQRGQNFFGQKTDYTNFVYGKSRHNTSKKDFSYMKLTPALGRLLGYVTGDGTCTKIGLNKNNIQMTVGDAAVERDYQRLCLKIFGEKAKVTQDKRTQTTKRLVIHNAKARAFFEYLGLEYADAERKSVPTAILQAPREVVREYLRGLFESDASFSGATIQLVSKSRKLIEQVQIILLNFGVIAKLYTKVNKRINRNYHYLDIQGQSDKQIFAEQIGFISQRKHEKLVRYLNSLKQPQTNVDVVPHLNEKLARLMLLIQQKVRPTNRADWNVVYDYLPISSKKCGLSYGRLGRILEIFKEACGLPLYQELSWYHQKRFYFDEVNQIVNAAAQVFDFTVPQNATFFANGFINHNTTLALHIIAEAQKRGGIAAFVDAEHALDPIYAKNIGVDVDDLLLSQPDTGEQALEITETLVRSGAVDVVVIDSVAALVPRAEIEGEMGDQHIGLQARLMSQALRKLTSAIARSNTTTIFLNQLRMKIGVMFGNPETTTGGMALKFYSSVRMDIRRIGQIKEGDQVLGNRTRVKIVKNKVAPPFKIAEFDIMYNEGISREGSLLDIGVEMGVVDKSGAWYAFGQDKLGQGREAAKAYLKENQKLAREIEKKIFSEVKAQGAPLAVGVEEAEEK